MGEKRSFTLSIKQRDYEYPNPNALQLSCFCSFHMILGHHQNYYNLAQQQRNELEALYGVLPRTGLSDRIYSEQPYHSNYPIGRRGPRGRRAHSCCSGTRGLFPFLGTVVLTTEKRGCSWL